MSTENGNESRVEAKPKKVDANLFLFLQILHIFCENLASSVKDV